MKNYDVAVVGAGPVGSTFARIMAEKGFEVAILEKKKEIGVPLQCAGLVGKRIKEVNVLPNEFIINPVHGGFLHSPEDTVLSVSKGKPEAYVLDRVKYDQFLAHLAEDSGAEILLNHGVEKIDSVNGVINLKNKEKTKISAGVVVGADGHSSIVSSTFNPLAESFQAAQYLIDVGEKRFQTNFVHLYVDSRVSPGFLWVIPLSESTARVGLFADANYQQLTIILNELLNKRSELRGATILKKYYGVIPRHDPHKQLVKDRVILLGDAASQVKPTTGGGLIMGFTSAEIASRAVSKALEVDNVEILTDYNKQYQERFKKELKVQLMVHKIFKSLNDDNLEYMFQKLKQEGAEDIISHYGDIDTQSTLVKEMFKRGIIFSILPKMLSWRISSLWK
ncbi:MULTISPECIES: geranylgeranyl reductase family protein [Methanobacterium]|jgi:geranylgeranyl reductase family protein|uniref:NAD(P)/FAD-dependent oxidoreductase n=1 Tax=Methanobacterium subterraneum TaxID=59277 RepID=A0A7K4DJV6_9EURY|nr:MULTISPECIES: NAD(P)/FAD-dependent oxidoreductase [Methanobacterium]AUB58169.1 geranylgeranyl reductase [Methanobacterium sp. MZ-A1]MBW4256812.1 NAD(P)/FAD-dependent oxidoreductase [Methanobacterium sp. YSL]MCC7560445.1 NAD(P)/FAD-dependent oxidoreductase [Methanobacterium sp.]NMO08721.1 NAD(P)/FAD-dependent oxidoreductase [Methanobacterium subterraneum]